MTLRNIVITMAILAAGAGGYYYLNRDGMFAPPEPAADSHGHGHGGHDDHEDEFERGPHDGRLLETGPFALEVTIFEDGMPPQFRIYPTENGEPVPLDQVDLEIQLVRLDRTDTIRFTPENDYLRGIEVVEEPHSFDVHAEVKYREHAGQFHFESHEGRVALSPEAFRFAQLTLDRVGPAAIRSEVRLPGEIALNQDRIVHIVPRMSGLVRGVERNLGEKVAAGDVLAVIDSRELAEAKSNYLAANEHRDLAQTRFKREKDLYERKVSAEEDYLVAEEAIAEARIRVTMARQQLEALGFTDETLKQISATGDRPLTRYEIRSPIDGVVVEKHITGGEAVTADADIFVVADLSSVWVEITVYAQDLSRILEGQSVSIYSKDLDMTTEGTVSYIAPLLGKETRSAKAVVRLENPNRTWRPGLYVTATVTENEVTVPLSVSTAAIQRFRDWEVVFAKFGDVYEIRPVELGRSDGTRVEVLSGVEAGREYVSGNSYVMKAELEKSGATHSH